MSILLLLSVYSVVVYKGIRKAFSVCREKHSVYVGMHDINVVHRSM